MTFLRDLGRDPARVVFVLGASGLLALSLVGLPLAILGLFTPWLVLFPTFVVWWALANYGLTTTARGRTNTSQVTSTIALVVALGFTIFTGAHSSEHLLTNRDPGVYLITGKWLAGNGNLVYDSGLPAPVAASAPTQWPQGVVDGGDGRGYFSFQHTPAVVLAAADWLGGDQLMFRAMSAVTGIGLLGIYMLGRRMAGPAFGLLPVVAASLHPAFVYVAKDAHSEPMALVFAMGALWVWLERSRIGARGACLATGLLLGAGALARIDGWITAIGFLIGVAYLVVTGREQGGVDRRQTIWLLLGFSSTAALSIIDLVVRSPVYLRAHSQEAVPMMAVFVLIAAVTLAVASRGTRVLRLGHRLQRVAPPLVGISAIVGGLYGLFIRPVTMVGQSSFGPISLVADLQAREGLEIDPNRTYAEMSVEWLARYQGYLPIVFGIAAVSFAAFLILRKQGDRRIPVLSASLGVMVVYLWRPSIIPDHLWAMRRFVPALLPLGFILTALAARVLLRKARGREWVSVGLAAILAISMIHSTVVGWPVASVRTEVGVHESIGQLCELLSDDTAVIFDESKRHMAGAVRTMCDAPITAAQDDGIIEGVIGAGLTPLILTSDTQCVSNQLGSAEITFEYPQLALSFPPRGVDTGALAWSLATYRSPEEPLEIPLIPDAADASLLIEVETTWAPEEGYSLIGAVGDHGEGMWLQYSSTAVVELWITTNQGHFGIAASPLIADGVPRIVGGYMEDGVLTSLCNGHEVAQVAAPGAPLFADGGVDLTPDIVEPPAMQPFQGLATIAQADVDPTLLEDRELP